MDSNINPYLGSLLEILDNEMVFALDQNYGYIFFNDFYKSYIRDLTGNDIKKGDNYFNNIGSNLNVEKAKKNIDRSLHGLQFAIVEEIILKEKKEIFLNKYSPVFKDDAIIGTIITSTNKTKERESEKIWQILLNISEEVHVSQNISELVKLIHSLLNELLYAKNFFICLYDQETDRYYFPFFIDEYDVIDTTGVGFIFDKLSGIKTYDLSKTITDYVRRTGKPLNYTYESEVNLIDKGEIELYGTPSPSWLGVPLKLMGKTVGVMAVQCYEKHNIYTKKEEDLLIFVSDHIARAIENKRAQEKIDAQHQIVVQQKNEITDSLNYARYIQNAILPQKELLDCCLKEYFILLKPKDIVSGDFYWISGDVNKKIVVAADCTGHGVPGAFMSMLGITLLNEIINKENIKNPAKILDRLRNEVISAMKQKGELMEQKDGMDIAICSIDLSEMKLQFAGANNPLYLIRNSSYEKLSYDKQFSIDEFTLYEISADKMPIGISDNRGNFTLNELNILKGDAIYLFSDGFADQFGGPDRKKLQYINFKKLLIQVSKQLMEEQKINLLKALDEWMGKNIQIDDILVIGFRIS